MKEPSEQSEQLREVICAAYRQSEEAVIALVENLLNAQADAIGKLEARIKVLETKRARIVTTAANHRPEMGLRNDPKVCVPKVDVKAGAGHPGSTLAWVNEPAEIEQQVIETCQGCGASLVEMPIVESQCAPVHDLVPIEMRVKEHQVAVKECACCGQRNQAAFPPGVTNRVQYGSGLRSLMVDLMDDRLLPSARVQGLLRALRFLVERYQQEWAEQMMTLLVSMKASIEQAQAQGQTHLNAEAMTQFKTQYQDLIETGMKLNPANPPLAHARGRPKQTPARNLLERLNTHSVEVLRFIHDF